MTEQEQNELEFEEVFNRIASKVQYAFDRQEAWSWARTFWYESRRTSRERLKHLVESQTDMPPEFMDFINKHFWELI